MVSWVGLVFHKHVALVGSQEPNISIPSAWHPRRNGSDEKKCHRRGAWSGQADQTDGNRSATMSLRASRPQKGGRTKVGRAAESPAENAGMRSDPATRTWSDLPAHGHPQPSNEGEVPPPREK